jgi:hypothetical protein
VAEDGSVYVMQYNQRSVEKIGLEEVAAPGE